jgi:serine/threonine protein kinase/tetratricopeptide (TPR) repeat protein
MNKIAGRYEIKAKLGEGGMGVVFRAYDTAPKMDREVAIKTLHEFADDMARELFYKECAALKSFSHPNIVEIFDMGEYEDAGHQRPFFVMPLLPGQTLDELIKTASHRLTVDRVVEIFAQTCRGLQAAHDRGLVHRDLKPSNIFVMADDSVKIIDFGVAHAAHDRSRSGYDKGTLLYMAPEQVQHKPVSVQSDVYSLGVTLYEALTRRQPFRGRTEESVVRSILNHIPPPASDLNPAVSHVISRVVHKAIAKQAWHRFDSAREFGDTLQKAHRNEPIALFDPSRTQPRVLAATKALEKLDYQFAGEIVSELEAEGNIDPQISMLRAEIDHHSRRKTVAQLLESARARFDEEEDPLALQKLQEVLQLDPTNVGALSLKGKIEDRRSERQIAKWIQLAQQHASNRSYSHARDALQNALALRPKDSRATRLLKEIESEEQEYGRLRREKIDLYQAAVNAWQNGEVSQALSQMKLVLDLDLRAPDSTSPDTAGTYQSFYNKVRSEHDAMNAGYADARRHLADKEFARALAICDGFLAKYPGHALFQALKLDVEEQQRQRLSAFIADVDRRLEAETDLDVKLSMVREAAAEFPEEDHFRRVAKPLQDKRDLVNSIVERARLHESSGQIAEAISDLETLRTIYAAYPGLKFEQDRLQKRLEQQTRDGARGKLVRQIDGQLHTGDHARAVELLDKAELQFPADPELAELRKLAAQGLERAGQVDQLAARGEELCEQGQFAEGIELLKSALELDDRNGVRLTLRDRLVGRAQELFETDWRAADQMAAQALELDPNHPLAKSLRARAFDKQREESVPQSASLARRLQAEGKIDEALSEIESALDAYPGDPRLVVIAEALAKERARVNPIRPLSPVASDAPTSISPQPIDPSTEERTLISVRSDVGGTGRVPTARPPSPKSPRPPQPAPPRKTRRMQPWNSLPSAIVSGRGIRKALVVIAVLAVVGVIGWVAMRPFLSREAPPPTPTESLVEITITPRSGIVRVDGKEIADKKLRLSQTQHSFVFSAPGYKTQELSERVKGDTFPLTIVLEPLPLVLQFSSNTTDAAAQLDKVRLEERAEVSPSDGADHTLVVNASARTHATITFRARAGAEADLNPLDQLPSQDATLIVISAFGSRVTVRSPTVLPVELSDKSQRQASAEGLVLERPSEGDMVLLVGSGSTRQQLTVPRTESPLLQVHLSVITDVGSIVVLANENDSTVVIDGKPSGTITNGRLDLTSLRPGRSYALEVIKRDFCVTPPQRTVVLRRGRQQEATFKMSRPTIRVTDVPQGGRVRLNGVEVDHQSPIAAQLGPNALQVDSPGYQAFSQNIQVDCGTPDRTFSVPALVRTSGRPQGDLAFTVDPANASVVVLRRQQGQLIPVPGSARSPLTVDAGDYVLRASADGYQSKEVNVSVVAGKTAPPIPIILDKIAIATWSRTLRADGGWQRNSSDISLFGEQDASGTYTFFVKRYGPFGLAKHFGNWIVAYRDPKNYVEVRVHEDGRVLRRVAARGDWTEIGRVPKTTMDAANKAESLYVRVHVQGGTVRHEIGATADAMTFIVDPINVDLGRFGLAANAQIKNFSASGSR